MKLFGKSALEKQVEYLDQRLKLAEETLTALKTLIAINSSAIIEVDSKVSRDALYTKSLLGSEEYGN
jgi:ABC-type Na+ efflux pump permease subunit